MISVREEDDHVTADQLRASLAELKGELMTEIASLETRLVKWIIATVIAAGASTAGILRLFG